jgi:UDP-glucuronate 4-epimerase
MEPPNASTVATDETSHSNSSSGKVLVTGGAGFIGSHVAHALAKRGESVIVVDQVNDSYDVELKRSNLNQLLDAWGDQIHVYEGDLCDQMFLKNVKYIMCCKLI